MKRYRWYLLAALLAAIAAGGLLRLRFFCPPLTLFQYAYQHLLGVPPPPTLRVTYLGVSTLLIEDGGDAILIDGFFTRPDINLFNLANSPVATDPAKVAAALAANRITTTTGTRELTLAAVIVNHSHHDHVLDAPEVAKQTGAFLVGSATTANIGRGAGVPEDRLRIFNAGSASTYCFARFPVTAVRTGHVGIDSAQPPQEVTTPLVPATVGGYLEGGTYAIFVSHKGRTLMVQGSAGFRTDALQSRSANVVYLSVGGLTLLDPGPGDSYWSETVGKVSPSRIFTIHWDALSGEVSNTSTLIGTAGVNFINNRAAAAGIAVVKPPVGEQHDPFEGL
jgi:L-ascorbate metabolism protein UlaG (beta-lactamase superfamily)